MWRLHTFFPICTFICPINVSEKTKIHSDLVISVFSGKYGKKKEQQIAKIIKSFIMCSDLKRHFFFTKPNKSTNLRKTVNCWENCQKVVQVIKKLPKTIKWTNFPTNYQRKHKVSTIQYLWQKLHYILQRFNARNTNFTQPLGAVLLILYQNITIKQVNKFFLKSFRNNHILYVLMNKIFDNPK